jgi:hypothetical protein
MKKIPLLILLCSTAAYAGTTPQDAIEAEQNTREWEDVIVDSPPLRYDHKYKDQVQLYLDGPFEDGEEFAWAYSQLVTMRKGDVPVCRIHISPIGTTHKDQKLDEVGFLKLFLHERAHCNGWRHGAEKGKE